ncbi:MAG: aspartate carbamoyltransferase [Verrucomicrobiota bacterium]|nr:aspartate carbamoyltransferase [Verrucomicrobiota bacterium]
MIHLGIEEFIALPESEQVPYIGENAVIYAQQFDRNNLEYLCRLSDVARKIHKIEKGADFLKQLLRHRLVLNFFIQPSSRTFLSFNAAETILGMSRMSVRDAKISSISKGETLSDSLRTFLSYVDLVVMRHPEDISCSIAYWISAMASRRLNINGENRPIPIVSGGAGKAQHPTQALLDIYTLQKSFENVGGIDGKTIMLVGDLKRGRTVRSLSYLMKNFNDVKLLFCAPNEYKMSQDIIDFIDKNDNISYENVDSISDAITEVDAIYMTRIQDEHDKLTHDLGHVKAENKYVFRMEHLKQMKKEAYLLHPLPKRDEIEEAIDFANDPRVVYWRQERNGMWMRVAIIAKLFGVGDQILDF